MVKGGSHQVMTREEFENRFELLCNDILNLENRIKYIADEIEKISVNLSSRTNEVTLKYDTEQ